jgi:hypothetical protein
MVAAAKVAKSKSVSYRAATPRRAAPATKPGRKAAASSLTMLALLCEPLATSASNTPRSPGLRRLMNALGDEMAAEAFAYKNAEDVTSVLEDEIYGARMIVLRRAVVRHAAEVDWSAKFDGARWRRELRRFAGASATATVDDLSEQLGAVMAIVDQTIAATIAARGGAVPEVLEDLLQQTEDVAQALSDGCPTVTDRSGAIGLAMLTPIHLVVAAANRGSVRPTASQRRAVLAQLRLCLLNAAIAIGADVGYGDLPFVPKSRRTTRSALMARLEERRRAHRELPLLD